MLLGDAIKEFMTAAEADGLSDASLRWYKSILGKYYDRVGDREITSITTKEIREYINWLTAEYKYKDDTISGHKRVQHRFWKWCHREWSFPNPMDNIAYPDRPKQRVPKAIDIEDIIKLYMVTTNDIRGKRDRAIIALLTDTACRAGGVVTLKVKDIDVENRRIIVREKAKRTRRVGFSPLVLDALNPWLEVRSPVDTLFYNFQTLQPLTPSGLRQILNNLKAKAGIEGRANPHSFRHGFARQYLKAGGDLATLQRIMGHLRGDTTGDYYAVFTQDELAVYHDEFSPIRYLKDAIDMKK